MAWKVKLFKPHEIRDCYKWIRQSSYHIALHENPYVRVFAYHVFGKDPERLKEFGREMGCHERMFSVMDTHGKKEWEWETHYHFDDYRKNVQEIYKRFLNERKDT